MFAFETLGRLSEDPLKSLWRLYGDSVETLWRLSGYLQPLSGDCLETPWRHSGHSVETLCLEILCRLSADSLETLWRLSGDPLKLKGTKNTTFLDYFKLGVAKNTSFLDYLTLQVAKNTTSFPTNLSSEMRTTLVFSSIRRSRARKTPVFLTILASGAKKQLFSWIKTKNAFSVQFECGRREPLWGSKVILFWPLEEPYSFVPTVRGKHNPNNKGKGTPTTILTYATVAKTQSKTMGSLKLCTQGRVRGIVHTYVCKKLPFFKALCCIFWICWFVFSKIGQNGRPGRREPPPRISFDETSRMVSVCKKNKICVQSVRVPFFLLPFFVFFFVFRLA